jgi:hypothetical protein
LLYHRLDAFIQVEIGPAGRQIQRLPVVSNSHWKESGTSLSKCLYFQKTIIYSGCHVCNDFRSVTRSILIFQQIRQTEQIYDNRYYSNQPVSVSDSVDIWPGVFMHDNRASINDQAAACPEHRPTGMMYCQGGNHGGKDSYQT